MKFLGPFELETPSGEFKQSIGAKASVLLLARLATPPGRAHDRKRLTEFLWPDRGKAQAFASLRQSLWTLRKALGPAQPSLIIADRSSVRLDPDAVGVDAVLFERLLRNGEKEDLEQAIGIYRGDFLEEHDLDDEDGLQPLLIERQRLRELALSGLKSLATLRAKSGDPEGAIEAAQRALVLNSLQEEVHAAIIRLHRDMGRPGLARDQYDACRHILQREFRNCAFGRNRGAAKIAWCVASKHCCASAQPADCCVSRPARRSSGANLVPSPASRSRPALLLPGIGAVAGLVLLLLFLANGASINLNARSKVFDSRPSIVVVPFEDMSVDGQQAEVAAGLTGRSYRGSFQDLRPVRDRATNEPVDAECGEGFVA